jgi:hypothetical protein
LNRLNGLSRLRGKEETVGADISQNWLTFNASSQLGIRPYKHYRLNAGEEWQLPYLFLH